MHRARGAALLAAVAVTGLFAAPAASEPLEPPLPTVIVDTDNTNDYPLVRTAESVTIRFGGVNSPDGGVIGVEPGLSAAGLNGGVTYAPCKGTATSIPNVEDPVNGGEPYKAACESAVDPSYYRSGPFGPGLRKHAPQFPGGITMGNIDTTRACVAVCNHRWAERLSRFDVEIYLKKKDPTTGRLVTDFDHVRPRFTVSSFPRRVGDGLVSADYGTVRPLKAYERGAARLQGLIFAKGTTRAAAGRVRFSMFENDANGRTSTGQLLQAFSVFTSTGAYYSTGTVYAGSYKLRLKDLETNRCVLLKHLPLPSMGQRVDFHLDRPAFGIPRARTVAC